MKIRQEQFNKAQETLAKQSLSNTQKEAMLANIYSRSEIPVVKSFGSYFLFFKKRAVVFALSLFLVISGISYASATSLPGEILYGVKTSIIEPIALSLRLSKESKNEYKIFLLQKRVAELETLKQRGGINESSQAASSRAVDRNMRELRNSAIFNEKGENIDVSEQVEVYNDLIDVKFRIKTDIEMNENDILDTNEKVEMKEEITDVVDSTINESEYIVDVEVSSEVDKNLDTSSQIDLQLDTESDS